MSIMAGDWIPFDHDFPEKPEVLAIMTATQTPIGEIMLRMHRFWRLVDRQTTNGVLDGVSLFAVAVVCGGDESFWKAVKAQGWLGIGADGSVFMPAFQERFSRPARARLLDARRKKAERAGQEAGQEPDAHPDEHTDCDRTDIGRSRARACATTTTTIKDQLSDTTTTDAATRPEEEAWTLARLANAWNAIAGVQHCRDLTDGRKRAFKTRSSDPHWLERLPAALAAVDGSRFCKGDGDRGWVADIDWFLKPETITRLLEGKYSRSKANGQPVQTRGRVRTNRYTDPAYVADDDASGPTSPDGTPLDRQD